MSHADQKPPKHRRSLYGANARHFAVNGGQPSYLFDGHAGRLADLARRAAAGEELQPERRVDPK